MIKRLVRDTPKKVIKASRAKAGRSSRPVTKRASKRSATIDTGTALAEATFLMYDAREAAHAKSKA